MNKATFTDHFRQAHTAALSIGRQFVVQNLPDEKMFLLYPNQSYDGNPLVPDQEIYPEESLPPKSFLGPLPEEEIVTWLWRNGKVPEWVNISVKAQDESFTYLELLCCGRYSDQDQCLYHLREGYPPFHALSPDLPVGWENLEVSGKFDLYWRDLKAT